MRDRELSQLPIYDGIRPGEMVRVRAADGSDLGYYCWNGSEWEPEDIVGSGNLDTTGANVDDMPQYDGANVVWFRYAYA